jgi:hypothetical protein
MKKVLTSFGALGVTAILLAGCGGSGSSNSGASNAGATSTGAGGPGGAQFQKYTKCLSKHGVDLPKRNGNGRVPGGGAPPNGGSLPEGFTPPNGGSLPDGVTPPNGGSLPDGVTPPSGGAGGGFPGLDQSDPTVKKALDACKSLQPSFPGGGNGFPGGAAPGGSNGGGGTSPSTTGEQST